MKQIPLDDGQFAKVDDEDYDRCMQHKWRAERVGKMTYAATDIDGEVVFMQDFIMDFSRN